jgi:hypothetical protein
MAGKKKPSGKGMRQDLSEMRSGTGRWAPRTRPKGFVGRWDAYAGSGETPPPKKKKPKTRSRKKSKTVSNILSE